MGIVKARKLVVRSRIFLFSTTVQDYGYRSADICLVMQAGGAFCLCVYTEISLLGPENPAAFLP